MDGGGFSVSECTSSGFEIHTIELHPRGIHGRATFVLDKRVAVVGADEGPISDYKKDAWYDLEETGRAPLQLSSSRSRYGLTHTHTKAHSRYKLAHTSTRSHTHIFTVVRTCMRKRPRIREDSKNGDPHGAGVRWTEKLD